MTISSDEFRQGMASWATGVTIVTARAGEVIHGMTVSDFGGLSMDPPLVLVCASKGSRTLEVIEEGGCFAVNVLAADQQELSNRFASAKLENSRFEGLEVTTAKTGAPLLPGTVAGLDCRVVATHDGGDHLIVVGEIENLSVSEREPLLHFRGDYRSLAAE